MIQTKGVIHTWSAQRDRGTFLIRFITQRIDDTDGEIILSELREIELQLPDLPQAFRDKLASVETDLIQMLRTRLQSAKDPTPDVTVMP